MARTMAKKVWEEHVVRRAEGEPDLLYIDLIQVRPGRCTTEEGPTGRE